MSEPTNQENEVKSDAERIQSQKDDWDALGEEAQQEIIYKHEKLESEDAEEEESAALIQEHLIQHNENKKNPAYLVRGAELMCSQGSNKRMMNLSPCHGVYIKMHAVVHELDCIQGDKDNITWFGVCTPGEGLETESIKLLADNGTECHGKKCEPHIIGTWMETHEGTKIVDNGDKLLSEEDNAKGCNTLTMDSFLVCKYGGIIMPITSGQDREVMPEEFAYDTAEEKKAAFDRVSAGCSENINREEGCDDLLHAKLGDNESGNIHGSEFENEELDEEDGSEFYLEDSENETIEDLFEYNWMTKGLLSEEFVTEAFLEKVIQISTELKINPDDLMAVMAFESWCNPAEKNSSTGATGLIQFTKSTAKMLETTVDDLAQMSAEKQLDYVYEYYKSYKGKVNDINDAYMVTLWPKAVGKPNDYVLFEEGSDAYDGNAGLDFNKDGKVTKEEACSVVIERRSKFEK